MQYEAEGDLFAVCLSEIESHVNGDTMVADHLGPGARIEVLRHYQEAPRVQNPGDTTFDEE